jgi:hypothetical protein
LIFPVSIISHICKRYQIRQNGARYNLLDFYNQRGCYGEHHFKELDYDFGWGKLPFDNLEMNTVYLYTMLVAYLLFNAVKKNYAVKLDFVNETIRLKSFILHFVTLPSR